VVLRLHVAALMKRDGCSFGLPVPDGSARQTRVKEKLNFSGTA